MRHFSYINDDMFIVKPMEFNRYSGKKILQYSLGATLYMPSTKDIAKKIINKDIDGLTTIAMCFEDAIREEELQQGEENVLNIINSINNELKNNKLTQNDIPLIFLRVRNPHQFREFAKKLNNKSYDVITGFIFPKFNTKNALEYLEILNKINDESVDNFIYGMPIIEDEESLYLETRMSSLIELRNIIDENKDYILNIRVGATDFSSKFGIRRRVDNSIYDIRVISNCLSDIVNIFGREGGYVISAPVWEFFSNQRVLKPTLRKTPFYNRDIEDIRDTILDRAEDGLIKEVLLDKVNGFIGKTVIHPSHIKIVNAFQCVTKEEYKDAMMILDNVGGGVIKGVNGKMNEVNPHLLWAEKIKLKSMVYGVVKDYDYIKLFDRDRYIR